MCGERKPSILSLNMVVKCVFFFHNISINMHHRHVSDTCPSLRMQFNV